MPGSLNQDGRTLAENFLDVIQILKGSNRTYTSPFSPLIKEKRNLVGSEAFLKSSDRETRLLKAKQALLGFANGSTIAAMADTGSRKNVMSESYAKSMGFTIEDSRSTFEIGDSRKIQSIGRSRCRDPQRSSLS